MEKSFPKDMLVSLFNKPKKPEDDPHPQMEIVERLPLAMKTHTGKFYRCVFMDSRDIVPTFWAFQYFMDYTAKPQFGGITETVCVQMVPKTSYVPL